MTDTQYVLVIGDPVDGITLSGPFDSAANASDTAEQSLLRDETWWVAPLVPIPVVDDSPVPEYMTKLADLPGLPCKCGTTWRDCMSTVAACCKECQNGGHRGAARHLRGPGPVRR